MKILNSISILIVLFFFQHTVLGQNKNKVGPALNGFLQTEFMLKFQDMRGQAEAMVTSFQSQSFQYTPSDVAQVQVSYDKTARRFNQVLINIKNDFLNNDKLKLISNNPEYYAKGLELEMYQLNDYYAQNFQQKLADVTGNQIDGNPIVLLLVQLVSGISGTVDHFAKIKKEARRYNEAYLTQHLVQPFRFKMWNEIAGGVAPMTGGNSSGMGGQQGGYGDFPNQYDPNNNYQDPMTQGDPNSDPFNQNGNFPSSNDPYYEQEQNNQGYDPNGYNPSQSTGTGFGNNTTNPNQGLGDWQLPGQNGMIDGNSSPDTTKVKVAKAPKQKKEN